MLNLVLKLILEINSDDVSMHFLTRIFSLIAPSFLLLIERKFVPSINRNFPSFQLDILGKFLLIEKIFDEIKPQTEQSKLCDACKQHLCSCQHRN